MKNGSDPLKFYVAPPVRPVTKVYFFNVTNPDEVLEGAIPNLVEVGPYVYKYVFPYFIFFFLFLHLVM